MSKKKKIVDENKFYQQHKEEIEEDLERECRNNDDLPLSDNEEAKWSDVKESLVYQKKITKSETIKDELKIFKKRDISEQFKQWIYDFYLENSDYDETRSLFEEYATQINSDFKYMDGIIKRLTTENAEMEAKILKMKDGLPVILKGKDTVINTIADREKELQKKNAEMKKELKHLNDISVKDAKQFDFRKVERPKCPECGSWIYMIRRYGYLVGLEEPQEWMCVKCTQKHFPESHGSIKKDEIEELEYLEGKRDFCHDIKGNKIRFNSRFKYVMFK